MRKSHGINRCCDATNTEMIQLDEYDTFRYLGKYNQHHWDTTDTGPFIVQCQALWISKGQVSVVKYAQNRNP